MRSGLTMDYHLIHKGGDSRTVEPSDRETRVLIIFLETLHAALPGYFNMLNLQILDFVHKPSDWSLSLATQSPDKYSSTLRKRWRMGNSYMCWMKRS